MNENLIKKYQDYCKTEEALAVLFVKKYLNVAKGMWIDILDIKEFRYYNSRELEFKEVLCELFKRRMKPKYPSKKTFKNQEYYNKEYYIETCRAICWYTAHEDINKQRDKGITGAKFIIEGVKYNENRKKSYFVDSAPLEIKALEDNLNDRTNVLWEFAEPYIRPKKFVFKIKNIRRTNVEDLD